MFPVYNIVLDKVKKDPHTEDQLNSSELKELKAKIYSLDKEGRDRIYVFARVHSMKTTNTRILDLPFGGEKVEEKNNDTKDGLETIKFDLLDFPPLLNRMISHFCDLHLIQMGLESERAKIDQTGGDAIKPVSKTGPVGLPDPLGFALSSLVPAKTTTPDSEPGPTSK